MTEPIPVPPPGAFGLSRIGGVTGWFVLLAQVLTGRVSQWTHAFLVLDDGMVIEAMPGGARIVSIADRLNHKEVVFCDAPVRRRVEQYRADIADLTDDPEFWAALYEEDLRRCIVEIGRCFDRIPYSFLNYPSMGLLWLGIRPRWLREWVASSRHMICSQLVDEVLTRAGCTVFTDRRLSQDVAPGDLDAYRIAQLEAADR